MLLAAGCGAVGLEELEPQPTEEPPPRQEPPAIAVGPPVPHVIEPYRIKPLDVLEVSLLGEEDMTKRVVVAPDGRLSYFVASDIVAGERTFAELRAAIRERLKEYFVDPQVCVTGREFAGNTVSILGQVRKSAAGLFLTRDRDREFYRDGLYMDIRYRYEFGRHLGVEASVGQFHFDSKPGFVTDPETGIEVPFEPDDVDCSPVCLTTPLGGAAPRPPVRGCAGGGGGYLIFGREEATEEKPLDNEFAAHAVAGLEIRPSVHLEFPVCTRINLGYIWPAESKKDMILAGALDAKGGVVERAGLAPNDPVAPVAEEINSAAEDTMIVGHLPFLGKLASALVAGEESTGVLAFRNGGVVCMVRTDEGAWAVLWAVTPDVVP